MALEVNISGGSESIELSDRVFGRPFQEALVHQVVTAERANARAGAQKQKNRSEVRGGGKKPWRQKGTGRARAGTIRSPIWTGGGVTFAARPRSYEQKINKKMFRGAICSMLSAMVSVDRLAVISDISLERRNTKQFVEALAARDAGDVDLLIVDQLDDGLVYSSRNLPHVRVVDVSSLGAMSLVNSERIAVTVSAKAALEEWLG